MKRPDLRIVPPVSYDTRPWTAANDDDDRLYRAVYPTLGDDWRDFIADVRAAPYSHALVALFTVIGWTLLLVLPLLIGAGK